MQHLQRRDVDSLVRSIRSGLLKGVHHRQPELKRGRDSSVRAEDAPDTATEDVPVAIPAASKQQERIGSALEEDGLPRARGRPDNEVHAAVERGVEHLALEAVEVAERGEGSLEAGWKLLDAPYSRRRLYEAGACREASCPVIATTVPAESAGRGNAFANHCCGHWRWERTAGGPPSRIIAPHLNRILLLDS